MRSSDKRLVNFNSETELMIANIVQILAITVSCLAWALFFVSIYAGKVIGVEVLAVVQIGYICMFGIEERFNISLQMLNGLSLSNSFNIFLLIGSKST